MSDMFALLACIVYVKLFEAGHQVFVAQSGRGAAKEANNKSTHRLHGQISYASHPDPAC